MRSGWILFPGLVVGLVSCNVRQTPDVAYSLAPRPDSSKNEWISLSRSNAEPFRLFGTPAASKKPSSDLVVAIAVREDEEWNKANKVTSTLSVVLFNQGDKPLHLWKDWCSWGWYNLEFEVTTKDGKKERLCKGLKDWCMNYPDFWTIGPKQALVRNVAFGSDDWTGLADLDLGRHEVRLRAIYEVHQDEDAKEHGVWTGRITSEEHEYTLDFHTKVDPLSRETIETIRRNS